MLETAENAKKVAPEPSPLLVGDMPELGLAKQNNPWRSEPPRNATVCEIASD